VEFKKKLKKSYERTMTDRKEAIKQILLLGYEGDYELALEILDEMIYLFDSVLDTPNIKAEFWHLKAITLNQLDRNEEALKAIEKSKEFLEISIKNTLKGFVLPSDSEDYDTEYLDITHSDILHDLGRYEEALNIFSIGEPSNFLEKFLVKHIKKAPVEPDIMMIQAHLLSHLEKNTEALELIDMFLKEEPNDLEGWFEKSDVLQELEKHDEALIACEKGLKINPDHNDLLSQKGLVLLDLKKPKEALLHLEQAILSDSTDDFSWYNKACALSLLNKTEESLDALTVATGLDSENIIQMKDDKDLDNIRDTERFKRLANQEI